MAYKPIGWVDGETPLNAENLNHMDEGIKSSVKSINGTTPDENGNVEIAGFGDSVLTVETITIGEDSGGGETEVTLSSISATYSGGDVSVGTAVTDLTGIVVTAHYSDGSTATVTGYTLSGEIAEGSNTVTVSYGGKTTTFTVTGIEENTGGGTAGQKIQFSTLEINSGMMGPTGSIVGLGSTYHVQLPYSDGMQISTGSNQSWDKAKFPPIVVYDNGTYTLPETTNVGSPTSVGGKYSTQMLATLTGYTENAVVYASFLAGGTLGSGLETNMDNADMFYYITGGAN